MKSSSFSVGAENLSEQAKEMELAGKAGQYDVIFNQHKTVMELYEQVIANIEKYLQEKGCISNLQTDDSNQELKDITMDVFMEKVESIIEACENFEWDEACEKTNELCLYKLNDKALNVYFKDVKTYIDDYEYESALDAIRKSVECIKEENDE